MSKQVRPSQESPSSLSPLPTAARPLSPRDLQSQASDVPFKDVHVVGWEDDLLASPTDTSATLFVITISTNKPLPANMNAPSSHALCIRRSFEEFFAFNAKLQDHLLHAKNQDAILLDKKRKQSLSFLTLPKRRKVTTQEDNEERVTLLDMYLQDVMSLSPVIWSLDFINDFFSPSPSDWEATRRRIQPDQVKARSNWRPGALFRPITLGRRNGNSDSRDVRGKTSNPPPTANIFSSNPSKGTLYSGEGNPAAITGNGILTLKPKNKGRRVGFAGDDDAPLEEDWLAPIEQRRRMSRQMNDLSSDDSNRRGSLLPKIQSANDETVSSSALNQVISALYDEAAKGPPRNSVVARKFVVASAVADADLQGGEVNAPLYNQVLASQPQTKRSAKRNAKN
ncbi:hypothetical protein DFJ73DRAFT_166610 [Zopfochytrium polystomum]|nr:hypothetical protein DFJ73DRAFT_166610 [Zopfochytrium polystomum]